MYRRSAERAKMEKRLRLHYERDAKSTSVWSLDVVCTGKMTSSL